jgi:hypothetical protein
MRCTAIGRAANVAVELASAASMWQETPNQVWVRLSLCHMNFSLLMISCSSWLGLAEVTDRLLRQRESNHLTANHVRETGSTAAAVQPITWRTLQ